MESEKNMSGDYRDIYRMAEGLKIPERKIIDFSTPSNPLGVSKKVKAELRKNLKYLHSYPDEAAKRLQVKLAGHHGIDPETVICGNGSTELIYLLARMLRPRRVLMPTPIFSGYERACRICCNPEIIYYPLIKGNNFDVHPGEFINAMEQNLPVGERQNMNSSMPDSPPFPPFHMVFLCNPNNPTGRLLKKDGVREISDAAAKLGCYLVIDEAFVDFCPSGSVIKNVADNPNLIVLRSMSPFYALSGLRLGYGVFPRQLAVRLREYREPWTVNSLAQRAAIAALKDDAYRTETLKLMQDEKKYLESSFNKLGIDFFSSVANFYMIRMDNAGEIRLRLQKEGILICADARFSGLDSTYIRIAVKSHRENSILIKELKRIFSPGERQHAV